MMRYMIVTWGGVGKSEVKWADGVEIAKAAALTTDHHPLYAYIIDTETDDILHIYRDDTGWDGEDFRYDEWE